jgi:hypothetical protein
MIDTSATTSQNWKKKPCSSSTSQIIIVQIARRNVLHVLLSLDLGSLSHVYKVMGTTPFYSFLSLLSDPKKHKKLLVIWRNQRAFRLVILRLENLQSLVGHIKKKKDWGFLCPQVPQIWNY